MTLDEAALDEAETYEFYEEMLPPGYDPEPITDRAQEMLREWDRYSTPEMEQEIVQRAKEMLTDWEKYQHLKRSSL